MTAQSSSKERKTAKPFITVVKDWDFVPEVRTIDLQNDPPEKIREFLDSLPFTQELKDELMQKILEKRSEISSEDTSAK